MWGQQSDGAGTGKILSSNPRDLGAPWFVDAEFELDPLVNVPGPSAMGMRYNPYGKTTDANPANIRTAFAHQDPRQRALFGAAFAVGYMARAAAAGI